MPLIILLVFFAVFAIVALAISATNKPKTSKQTKATLASVIKSPLFGGREEVVDVRKQQLLSSIPWLHNLLSGMNLPLRLRHILNQADLKWTPGKLIFISLAVWIASGFSIHLWVRSAGAALLLGLVAGAGPFLYVLKKRQHRLNKIQHQLPDTLDLMVSALRAGQSLAGALGAAAREAPEPIGREFRSCFEEQNFGIDLRTAMQNLLERVPLQDMRMMSTAMLIHKESGGNLAEVLDKTGHVVRLRFQLQQQIRVHTAQGRLSGFVLVSLPPSIGVVLYILNPGYVNVLFSRPVGHLAMAIAAGMNVVGLLVIRRIINIRI